MDRRITETLRLRSKTASSGVFLTMEVWNGSSGQDEDWEELDFDEVAALRDACSEHLREWGR